MSSSGASDDSVYEDEGGPSTEEDLNDEESTADADISDKEMPLKSGSEEVKITEQPNLHRISTRKKESGVATSLVWFYGFKTLFHSWEEFDEAFDEFQRVSFQQFSKRTSTSVATRNKQIVRTTEERRADGKKSRKEVILIPEKWETYSKTLVCTHGQPYEPRGVGKRNHRKVRDTKCSARVNVCVTATARGRWVLRAKATGDHNHDLNRHLWESYAENRVVTDSRLKNDVVVMHKAGANAYGILQYLRERTGHKFSFGVDLVNRTDFGKKTILRDVHNMVQRHKQQEQAGFSDAQRAFAVLEEFCRQNDANSAEVVLDTETNIARIATFQTARMKRLFKAFPEVVMVDTTYTTHNTNASRYKLFSFVVHDVFGKGQYVHHSLVDSEHKDNLRRVVEIFKENNPDWTKVQVVMSDKAVHEKDVLHEMLPQARQLLCQWHVITWLKKQTARLAKPVKKEVKALMRLLVYAESRQEYDDAKGAMLQKLGRDASHELYKTFMENWDNSQDEWVSYRRGNVPHLTNNTNNRIESKWGKLKDIINESFSIDQLLSTLITLQEYSEEQYLKEYHRVGSRPARICEDPELSRLGLQLSAFAFDLVSKQHTLATGETADYDVELGENGRALACGQHTGMLFGEYSVEFCNCILMEL
ncbi:Hypothetical protein PHPALM_2336 [Phytophthora palmivora]|uniref:ZSWIM1/3 RNaseH-like domain-containing protein n=1 Tax=Phytophthora palmivora TaxID=4796 RepID=A0A2P4YQ06_9STRA|nr:Hypothetical protein PHPALM_2336 [Phytophthora palmivora]